MGMVNADVAELLQTWNNIKTAITSIETTRASMSKRYRDLGNSWKDKKYDELGDVLQECNRAFNEVLKTLTKGEKYLDALAKSLMEYEQTNLDTYHHVSAENAIQEGISTSNTYAGNEYIAAMMVSYGFTGKADFGNLDVKTSKDIFKSVAETVQMFPELDLRFVGSAQARNKHIADRLTEMYLNAYRRHYPSASDEELMPFVQQQVADDLNGFEIGERTIAQSLFIDTPETYGEEVVAEFNGISINESYGADYQHFTEVRRSDVLQRWKPEGCDTPQATVDHELGHQIARLTDAHNDPYIQELYSQFMCANETQREQSLSGYAGESIHEFIAEGWSEYRNNPNCRPLATEISTRMIELYNQSTPHLVRVRRR